MPYPKKKRHPRSDVIISQKLLQNKYGGSQETWNPKLAKLNGSALKIARELPTSNRWNS